MLRSVEKLLSQAPLARGSCALPSILLVYATVLSKDKAATVTKDYTLSVTIDSPSLPSVIKVSSGDFFIKASNQHGEADYAIWYHCIHESLLIILVVSSDTDTWVYGLSLGILMVNTLLLKGGMQSLL